MELPEDIGSDFHQAKTTVIVSDLHLCEAEPLHPKYPLWKRYKSREFFFDKEFSQFLDHIQEKSRGESIELILNGDIFDFDSVTSIPENPIFRLTWLERTRGLHPQEEKSKYKIDVILRDHKEWVDALRAFILNGHRAIFIIGNHDLELHFRRVQESFLEHLNLPQDYTSQVRFCEWFYISNGDTLVEHGNQYDPYCMAQDPVHPYLLRFNRIEVRLPFGNLATRYMINSMGFFNPHVESNYIMSAGEYVRFFFRYMLRAQPLIVATWIGSATVILFQSFVDRLRPSLADPLTIEDRIENIAAKANAPPRVARELKELFVAPAASYPTIIARELWLDRAFLIFLVFFIVLEIFLLVNKVFGLSFFWIFIPLFMFLPFFLFYSKNVTSTVQQYKEPKERILSAAALIAKVPRIIYGHTHIVRHEFIGAVEHLNSGTWSPAFLDVGCEKRVGQKSFVWISPGAEGEGRVAHLMAFENSDSYMVFNPKPRDSRKNRTLAKV